MSAGNVPSLTYWRISRETLDASAYISKVREAYLLTWAQASTTGPVWRNEIDKGMRKDMTDAARTYKKLTTTRESKLNSAKFHVAITSQS